MSGLNAIHLTAGHQKTLCGIRFHRPKFAAKQVTIFMDDPDHTYHKVANCTKCRKHYWKLANSESEHDNRRVCNVVPPKDGDIKEQRIA